MSAVETVAAFKAMAQEPPVPTGATLLHNVFGRQDDTNFDRTCGYWSFSDRSENPFSTYDCGAAGCTSSGEYWGCTNSFRTTCYDSTEALCTATSLDAEGQHGCCTLSGFPNCVTAYKNVAEGEFLTAYECWAGLHGEYPVFTTFEARTVTVTNENSEIVTSTRTNTGVAADTDNGEDSRQPETTEPSTSDSQSTSTSTSASTTTTGRSGPADGSDDPVEDNGSDVPIGAIVGGVIGGVALILLAVFGWWFMRNYKKKHAAAGGAPPGTSQSELPGTPPHAAQQQPMYQVGGGGYYQQPAPQEHGHYAPPKPVQPGAWGYALPPENKPPHMGPVEMPTDHGQRHELQ